MINKQLKSRQYYLMFIIIVLLFLNLNAISQTLVSSVNLDKIYQKRKIKFIHNNYLNKIKSFDELYPKCINEDSSSYHIQRDTYIVDENINVLWNKYKSIDLQTAYKGKLVKFGFLYSRIKNKLVYLKDDYSGIEVGQVVFIRLDLLRGIKKLVVAYEVTGIDDKNKTMQFCYINNGKSEGSQKISLKENEDGKTKITHTTLFKSNSKLRDKLLYPAFHKRVVRELHHNLISSLH